jgi:hypothetical protein
MINFLQLSRTISLSKSINNGLKPFTCEEAARTQTHRDDFSHSGKKHLTKSEHGLDPLGDSVAFSEH